MLLAVITNADWLTQSRSDDNVNIVAGVRDHKS